MSDRVAAANDRGAARHLLVLATLLHSTAAAADPHAGASVHGRIGSVAAPFHTDALPELRSEFQAYALVGAAWYAFADRWVAGARFPVTTSSVEQPGGSYVADYTVGNLMLDAERRLSWSPGAGIVARLGGGAGVPLAGHGDGPGLVRNRVVAASDALGGWLEPELYQPGIVPLVASAGVRLERDRWVLEGRLKLPLLVRVHDASLPPEARARRVGLVPSLALGATRRVRPWLALGLGGHAVGVVRAPVAPTRDIGRSGRIQLAIAPRLALVGRRLSLALDLLVQLGGPLDGTVGLGAHLAWQR